NTFRPASIPSRIRSTGTVFVTPTSFTSRGSRPDRAHAALIRSRIAARFPATESLFISAPTIVCEKFCKYDTGKNVGSCAPHLAEPGVILFAELSAHYPPKAEAGSKEQEARSREQGARSKEQEEKPGLFPLHVSRYLY